MARIPKPKAKVSEDAEVIDASSTYDEGEFHYDPKGYLLIRINPETKRIEAGHCMQNNVIVKLFSGNTAKEVTQAVIKSGIISRLDHAAYVGRETMKAQIARELGKEYVQDSELEMK